MRVEEIGTRRTFISLEKVVLLCDLLGRPSQHYTGSSRWRQEGPLPSNSNIDLSVCLQGSHENMSQYIFYYQQGYLFFRKRILTTLSNSYSTFRVRYCILGQSLLEHLSIPSHKESYPPPPTCYLYILDTLSLFYLLCGILLLFFKQLFLLYWTVHSIRKGVFFIISPGPKLVPSIL